MGIAKHQAVSLWGALRIDRLGQKSRKKHVGDEYDQAQPGDSDPDGQVSNFLYAMIYIIVQSTSMYNKCRKHLFSEELASHCGDPQNIMGISSLLHLVCLNSVGQKPRYLP